MSILGTSCEAREIIGFRQTQSAYLKSGHTDGHASQVKGFGGRIKLTKGLKTIGCIG
jgi:hypothetical protein